MSLTILGRNQRLVHLLPEAKELRITGFQSPAEDEKEEGLSLDALTSLGAPHVWVVRVEDDSLIGFGMYPGDRLVVDRGTVTKREQYVVVDLDDDGCYRVRLMDLSQRGEVTRDLFAPAARAGSDRVMAALDAVNKREGAGTLRLGRVPVDPWWGMKREMKSRCYTTKWDEVIGVTG